MSCVCVLWISAPISYCTFIMNLLWWVNLDNIMMIFKELICSAEKGRIDRRKIIIVCASNTVLASIPCCYNSESMQFSWGLQFWPTYLKLGTMLYLWFTELHSIVMQKWGILILHCLETGMPKSKSNVAPLLRDVSQCLAIVHVSCVAAYKSL